MAFIKIDWRVKANLNTAQIATDEHFSEITHVSTILLYISSARITLLVIFMHAINNDEEVKKKKKTLNWKSNFDSECSNYLLNLQDNLKFESSPPVCQLFCFKR